MKKLAILGLSILVVVFILAVGFWAGRRLYGRTGVMPGRIYFGRSFHKFGPARGERMFGARKFAPFGYLEVAKKDGNKLTVKFPDGSVEEVNLSGDTLVYNQSKGSLDDIKEGDKIIIRGNSGFGQTVIVQK